MIRKLADLLMVFSGRRLAWRLGRYLYMNSRRESREDMQTNGELAMLESLFARFASRDERLVLIDVGANVGDWSHHALDLAARHEMKDRLELHAFEPVPATFQALEKRLQAHRMGAAASAVPMAVSSSSGKAKMVIAGENAGRNSMHLDHSNGDGDIISVETITLEAYCKDQDIPMAHYIKCDAEGHDMEVLNGAKNLLQGTKVMVFQFEYNATWIASRHYLKDAFDLASGLPYSLGKITPGGVEIYPEWHPELERFFESNYVLIADQALPWFKVATAKLDRSNTYVP